MAKQPKKRVIVAYIPVLHKGYLQFFKSQDSSELYILGSDLVAKLDYLRKDLRALPAGTVQKTVSALRIFDTVDVLTQGKIIALDSPGNEIVLPDEDISREVAKLFKRAKVSFYPVFLRWDRRAIETSKKMSGKEKKSSKKADSELMVKAYQAAGRSSDIWRRVGAVLLDGRGREIGVAANRALPNQHSPWMEGDPRNVYKQGLAIEVSVFAHCEASLIADAAKRGISTEGGSLYVTTFPCPVCAKMIADSGIAKLYVSEGYGVLDGYRTLADAGVDIYRVPVPDPADTIEPVWVPYKKSS